VGVAVGVDVGDAVGVAVAVDVAVATGVAVGVPVGVAVGETVGVAVGVPVGEAVGDTVGVPEGVAVGETVGVVVGVPVGDAVGDTVGVPEGVAVGEAVGVVVAVDVAVAVGDPPGVADGVANGVAVGVGPACAAVAKPIASESTNRWRMTIFVSAMTNSVLHLGILTCGLKHAPTGRVRMKLHYIVERRSAKASTPTVRGGPDGLKSLVAASRGEFSRLIERALQPREATAQELPGGDAEAGAGERPLGRLGARGDSAISSASR